LRAISFCRQKGTVSEEHMCLGCLGYALFRTGQWKKAIENARKVLIDEDALPVARAAVAVVPATRMPGWPTRGSEKVQKG
jgi:hypothetical protein